MEFLGQGACGAVWGDEKTAIKKYLGHSGRSLENEARNLQSLSLSLGLVDMRPLSFFVPMFQRFAPNDRCEELPATGPTMATDFLYSERIPTFPQNGR